MDDKDIKLEDIYAKYKCAICGGEFYVASSTKKMRKQDMDREDIVTYQLAFASSTTMMLMSREERMRMGCPYCHATSKNFQRIYSEKELKEQEEEKKKKLEQEKKESKEQELKRKIKAELEKEKEQEAKEDVCSFIFDRFSELVDELEEKLKARKITPEAFKCLLYARSFDILEERKDEFYPSNRFINSYRNLIWEFGEHVEATLAGMENEFKEYIYTSEDRKEDKAADKEYTSQTKVQKKDLEANIEWNIQKEAQE